MVVSINPQMKTSEDNTERSIELYFVALALVTSSPSASICCCLGKKKYIKVKFKLPILMNRFMLLEEINDLEEFKTLLEKGKEVAEWKILKVNPFTISGFSDLCHYFEYHALLGEYKIACQISIINIQKSLMRFIVEYLENKENCQIRFKFFMDPNVTAENEKKYYQGLANILGETFQKMFGILDVKVN